MNLISKIINFILTISIKYNIDESHGIMHSMNVVNYAHKIFNSEVYKNNYLIEQEEVIYISSLLHDMSDKKYIDEDEGMTEIINLLKNEVNNNDIVMIKKIISNVSYSKVKKNGFPDLGNYQLAYDIVREADLLSGYDFDRSMVYSMRKHNNNIEDAFKESKKLFNTRVFTHINDNLFKTEYGKREANILHIHAMTRLNSWDRILNKKFFNSHKL
jgi:HD superfamily phosphodiesterase